MDLQTIATGTPRMLEEAALFAAIAYPIYSGLVAMVSTETFIDVIKKPETAYAAVGLGTGKLLYDYASLFF